MSIRGSYLGPERRKPVLVVQHALHEHPAALLRALESQGIVTQWIHPYNGDWYPDVREISGIISMGGPMGANDEAGFPWITREIELLRQSVESELPTVGICLGGQMMARALGGYVERHPHWEVGWFPVRLTAEGRNDPIVAAAGPTPTVYHWHQDTFHLPPEAVLLGESSACARQLFRLGERAYGFQFHPEADHNLVLEWLEMEGVPEEILSTQKLCGKKTVQGPRAQRNYAMKGEKSSLKIAAAIGTLFRRKAAPEISDVLQAEIERLTLKHQTVVIEFEGANRKVKQLRGTIDAFLSLPIGEFLLFEDKPGVLWPVRLCDIQAIRAG